MSGDLCVFLVDNGSTHEFSVEKYVGAQVEALQYGIYEELGIEPENQVLIMESGVQLQHDRKLAHYSCGTGDSNPIFLFSKRTIQNPDPPSASVHDHSYEASDVKNDLERSLGQTGASIELVQSRTNLARRVVEVDQKLASETISLTRDQHLQHQGWLASVANLEKYTEYVLDLNDQLSAEVTKSRDQLNRLHQLVAQLPEALDSLKAFPMPQSLFDNLMVSSGPYSNNSSFSSSHYRSTVGQQPAFSYQEFDNMTPNYGEQRKSVSLYDFLSKNELFFDLDQLGSQMGVVVAMYGESSLQLLGREVGGVVDEIRGSEDMKRIRNFSDRLGQLEKSGKQLERAMQRQDTIHNAFVANRTRLHTIGDRSVLSDLCTAHIQQLQEMSENHVRIVNVNHYNKKAKEELSQNLHLRLQWIVKMQSKLVRCESQIKMRKEYLKRVAEKVKMLEQVLTSAEYACKIVTEICRRKQFSSEFLEKGLVISSSAQKFLTEEHQKRSDFYQRIATHFLFRFFPFLTEPFPANQILRCPEFDQQLPEVTAAQLDSIANSVPSLAYLCSVDSAPIDLSKLSVENAEVADAEVMTTATREDALLGEEYSTLRVEGTNVAANAEVDVSETEKVAYLCNRLSSILRQQEDLSTSRLNDSLKNLLELLHNQMNTEETESDTQTASTQTDFEEPVSKLDVSTETENTTITEEIEMKLEERVLLEVETQTDETDETTPPPSATTSGIASSVSDGLLSQSYHAQAENQTSFNLALNALAKEKNVEIVKLRREVKIIQVKLKLLEKSESESSTGEASLEQSLRTLGAPMDRSVTSEMNAAGEVDSKQRNKWEELALESKIVNRIHHSQIMSVVISQPKPLTDSVGTALVHCDVTKSVNVSSCGDNSKSTLLSTNLSPPGTSPPMQQPQSLVHPIQIKIALNDFRANDLVLIEFDSPSGHYRLFSVTNTPYFLHEDCYERLGVNTQSRPEIKKRDIAVFVSKEHCKVRKTSFNLALNALTKEKNAEIVKLRREVKMLQVKLKLLEKSESESSTGEASLEQSLRTLGAPMDRSVTSEMDAAGEVDSKQRNKWKELASESIIVNRIHHSQSMSVVISQPKPLTDSVGTALVHCDVTKSVNVSSCGDNSKSTLLSTNLSPPGTSPPMQQPQSLVLPIQIKIALNDFRANDLVLIEFDSPSGHYRLFSVTNTPYFLHEECYERLGVNTQSSPESKKRDIAVFVSKEHCKVRKPNNRFNLQVGQRFYRVKVDCWTKSVPGS